MSERAIKLVTTPDGVVAQRVELGRDASRRPFQRELLRPWRKRYQCVCCRAFTLGEVDFCDICPRCGWEDWYECHDAPAEEIRPNRVSLNQARYIVAQYGPAACSHVNRAGGMSMGDIERMSRAELATLRSIYT